MSRICKESRMYRFIFRPFLFCLDPETAHHLTLSLFKLLQNTPFMLSLLRHFFCHKYPQLACQHFGLSFSNPLGVSAGFDKNAEVMHTIEALGFGFMEIGTITPQPQKGNPKKRLFRLPAQQGIINRMGMNNDGVLAVVKRLKKRPKSLIIGANIAKNTHTLPENAIQDYCYCVEQLSPYVDYFVLNLSCPNVGADPTQQDFAYLQQLLDTLEKLQQKSGRKRPILLKISPDLTESQLDELVHLVINKQLAGIVATNTTLERKMLPSDLYEKGGLSGQPLFHQSTAVLRYLHQRCQGAFTLVGVGGITCVTEGKEKIQAGADLIQIYSGWIYQGMSLPQGLLRDLAHNKKQVLT